MAKKKIIRKSNRTRNRTLNLFAEGGEVTPSTGSNSGGIISGASTMLSTIPMGIYNSQIDDGEDQEAEIERLEGFQSSASSNESLMSEWGSYSPMDQVTSDQFLGEDNTTDMALTGLSGGATVGAAIGSVVPGIGTVIGGVAGGIIGGLGGLVGGLFSRNDAENAAQEQADDFNQRIDAGNEKAYNSMLYRAGNIDTQNDLNALANFSANGGPIDIFGGGAIDYQLASENAKNKELNTMSKYRLVSMPNSFESIPGIKTFGEGGNLYSNIPNIGQHGGIFSNGVTIIGNGGTHEENSMQGVPMGMDNEGIPNLVEEGEVKYNDYIFSNRLKIPKEYKKKYKVKGDTFADVANEIQKESSERPNDPISKAGLEKGMGILTQTQEMVRQEMQAKEAKKQFNNMTPEEQLGIMEMANQQPIQGQQFACGGKMKGRRYDEGGWTQYLRYVPAAAYGAATITDALGWTNQPDYTNAELVEESGKNLRDVSATPLGNYLTYNPLDRNYYTNKLNAQAGATRSAIVNQSGGNRATATAGLLAADYNAQGQLGDLARQAEEYNLNQRMQVEQFNRGTNQFNSQQSLQADIANQGNDRARMQATIQGAQMREKISGASDAAKSGNMNNFLESLGDIGREHIESNTIATNPANYYTRDSQGNIKYNKDYEELSDEEKKAVQDHAESKDNKKAKGGYLTIRKKK